MIKKNKSVKLLLFSAGPLTNMSNEFLELGGNFCNEKSQTF